MDEPLIGVLQNIVYPLLLIALFGYIGGMIFKKWLGEGKLGFVIGAGFAVLVIGAYLNEWFGMI